MICLIAFPYIRKMPSFVPDETKIGDIRQIDRRHASLSAKAYFLSSGYPMMLLVLMVNFMALYVLDSVVNIGIWETVV